MSQQVIEWAYDPAEVVRQHLNPMETRVTDGPPPVDLWDIPQTIPQLAYLTHNYFRYYGKFPSVIPKKLIETYRPAGGQWVLDNFAGSGTTLVEARLAGVPAVGTDVSPLGALAGRVKTTVVDSNEIVSALGPVIAEGVHLGPESDLLPPKRTLEKWFTEEATAGLGSIKAAIRTLEHGPLKELFALAFLGIVRRVSRAYDGEVRPHINPNKRPRDPMDAFGRKVQDMAQRMSAFSQEASRTAPIRSIAADSRDLLAVIPDLSAKVGLAISHPPYLNCFDYAPVFRLEYEWGAGFDDVGLTWSYDDIRRREIKSWPATQRGVIDGYFEGLVESYEQVRPLMASGGRCCVVIGDATVRGEVISVHERFTEDMRRIGFELERTILRSTHYGTGKYAYADRADYHGSGADKRDGILVFLAA